MILAKKLEWLSPYIEEAKKIVPEVKKVKKVSCFKFFKDKRCPYYGMTIHLGKDKYEIKLNRYYNKIITLSPLKFKKSPYSKIDILCTLAHEIAHLVEWDHTPERQRVEAGLVLRFMDMLEDTGYVSEEAEFKIKLRNDPELK